VNSYLTSLGSSLANHLWQSTAFAVVVWLLALSLRKNQARVRYALWLAASVKFLIPFSLLLFAGKLLPHPKQRVVPVVYSAMDTLEEPFATLIPPAAPLAQIPTLRERAKSILPSCLGCVWLVGVGTVVFGWWNRWRVVSASLHQATPAAEGRELETLRHLEERFLDGLHRKPLPLLLSPERMEPGIFGVFRPVLVWPEQLSKRLDNEQVEAIIAHELTHVRRRDNLTAFTHMLVEAAFWFHPLVWWMERKMVTEREQACDEAVMNLGGSAETYAESLLKTCRFCIESPLPCVAGVTGADLRRRVADILTRRLLMRMTWAKKLLLGAIAVCAVAVPVVLGQAKAALLSRTGRASRAQSEAAAQPLKFDVVSIPQDARGDVTISKMMAQDAHPSFEVATIKPTDLNRSNGGGFSVEGRHVWCKKMTTNDIIEFAYGVDKQQMADGPAWLGTDKYDIDGVTDIEGKPDMQQMQEMYRKLLAERFNLKVQREQRDLPVYALMLGKGNPKIAKGDSNGLPHVGFKYISSQLVPLKATNATMGDFVFQMQGVLNRPVVDQTGLKGRWDFTLQWTPDDSQFIGWGIHIPPASDSPTAQPGLFTAIQEQLGLKLKATKAKIDVIMIDHIDKPTPN
jgi:bla regulator protein BlaR1